MFGRQLAVTLIKRTNKKNDFEEPIMEHMTLDDISDTVVSTTGRIAMIVVLTSTAITGLKIAEHVVKRLI
jgi:hypothetical protein